MTTTLLNLMPMTAAAASSMLTTPADRIGSGAKVRANLTANSLSLGHLFAPHLPSREQVRGRQRDAALRYRPSVAPPTGPVGSVNGLTPAKRGWQVGNPWPAPATQPCDGDCQSLVHRDAVADQFPVAGRAAGLPPLCGK